MGSKSAKFSGCLNKFKTDRFWLLLSFVAVLFIPACKEKNLPLEEIDDITLIGNDSRFELSDPSWSPGGDFLAVTGSYVCGFEICDNQIFTLNIVTKELLPLGEKGHIKPEWTFVGNEISFIDGELDEIYTLSGNGGIPQKMTEGEQISWSRNGQYAAVVRKELSGEYGLTRSVVYVQERGLSDPGIMIFETPVSQDSEITGVAWSFDNIKIALSARWRVGDGYKNAVFIVNMLGYSSRQLAENIEQPGWLTDNWLFFIKDNKLGFAPLDYKCEKFPYDFEGLSSPKYSRFRNQIAFEHESKIYLLDLSEMMGQLNCDK